MSVVLAPREELEAALRVERSILSMLESGVYSERRDETIVTVEGSFRSTNETENFPIFPNW